mgnify:FL=1
MLYDNNDDGGCWAGGGGGVRVVFDDDAADILPHLHHFLVAAIVRQDTSGPRYTAGTSQLLRQYQLDLDQSVRERSADTVELHLHAVQRRHLLPQVDLPGSDHQCYLHRLVPVAQSARTHCCAFPQLTQPVRAFPQEHSLAATGLLRPALALPVPDGYVGLHDAVYQFYW